MTRISENITSIQQKITAAAKRAGRDPVAVNLVAVSKKQPIERVRAALDAGHRLFGENRVQEAAERWQDLKTDYPDVKLHFIGPLQTNKVKEAVAFFDCIETVDREKLADHLAAEMEKQERRLPCFIEINIGEEPQKAGVSPAALPDFLAYCRDKGLDIIGLMCIPPVDEPSALHFALLQKLAAENGLDHLSMGMSSDFEKAVPLGATYVRVGTTLFGEREKS